MADDYQKRIYGIETEYGVTCTLRGQRRLSPDEVARYLFRKVVSWGRSSNVFLVNGSRLYLDVGSHPEYATAECDSIGQVVIHDKAGERILEDLVTSAELRLHEEGIKGKIHLFKNNTDSAGNSYGCHENYLTKRTDDLEHYSEILIPFLISRSIYAGAGKLMVTSRGPRYSITQRAEHIWEGVSSATTRSRPIINTRDEPHGDAEFYRRLHVIVGDSNMSEYTTYLKVGAMAIVLRMVEDDRVQMPDMKLENPIRAIRDISHDLTMDKKVRKADGSEITALEMQKEFLDQAVSYEAKYGLPADEKKALEMWVYVLGKLETDPFTLDRELDWVIKHNLIESYKNKHNLAEDDPRLFLLDLQYHDIHSQESVFYKLQNGGAVERTLTDEQMKAAIDEPPQTTRAKLRGEFIKKAKDKKRDFTVDWVHLKLNDQSQKTILCKDPFKHSDHRVDILMDSL